MRLFTVIFALPFFALQAWAGGFDGRYEGEAEVTSGPCQNVDVKITISNGRIIGTAMSYRGSTEIVGEIGEDGVFKSFTVTGFAEAKGRIEGDEITGTWDNSANGCGGDLSLTKTR